VEVLNAVEPLNHFVCDLHGPSSSIARTMRRLVPFPEHIESLPDADLLDLSVAVSATGGLLMGALRSRGIPSGTGLASVQASGRYATSARMSQIEAFYRDQFERAGASMGVRREPHGFRLALEADVAWTVDPSHTQLTVSSYRVSITEERGYRSVRVAVGYEGFDHREIFERFAEWHNGDAPVPSMGRPTGIEISTYASGRKPETIALYTTHYHCDEVPHTTVRTLVDDRIRELGWGYREPREGIMFMSDAAFDAETHVLGGDDGSTVTFVGEFQLR